MHKASAAAKIFDREEYRNLRPVNHGRNDQNLCAGRFAPLSVLLQTRSTAFLHPTKPHCYVAGLFGAHASGICKPSTTFFHTCFGALSFFVCPKNHCQKKIFHRSNAVAPSKLMQTPIASSTAFAGLRVAAKYLCLSCHSNLERSFAKQYYDIIKYHAAKYLCRT